MLHDRKIIPGWGLIGLKVAPVMNEPCGRVANT